MQLKKPFEYFFEAVTKVGISFSYEFTVFTKYRRIYFFLRYFLRAATTNLFCDTFLDANIVLQLSNSLELVFYRFHKKKIQNLENWTTINCRSSSYLESALYPAVCKVLILVQCDPSVLFKEVRLCDAYRTGLPETFNHESTMKQNFLF